MNYRKKSVALGKSAGYVAGVSEYTAPNEFLDKDESYISAYKQGFNKVCGKMSAKDISVARGGSSGSAAARRGAQTTRFKE